MNVSFNGTIPEDCWGGTVTGLRISANDWLVLVPLCWCYHHHYNCTLATCNRADSTVQPSIGVPSGLGQLVGDPSVPLFHDIHICACNSLPLCLQLTVAGVYILMFITIFSEDCISWFALAFYMLFFEPITCTHVEWCMELIWYKVGPVLYYLCVQLWIKLCQPNCLFFILQRSAFSHPGRAIVKVMTMTTGTGL